MIFHIIRKDLRLLWPLVLLVTAIQVLLAWTVYRWGYFDEDLAARTLYPGLSIAWYLGIIALTVAVVHQDPIPGMNQDWLIRPVKRRDLLFAKIFFAVAAISLPMLMVDLFNALGAGFTLAQALAPAALKEAYVLLTLIVPLLALASVTENWPQIFVGTAVLMVLFALCLIGASFAIGPDRCPTCGTGLRWIQSLLEHGAVLVGAILILGLQYFHRQTSWARWLIATGIILFTVVQLPWSMAIAIQQRFSVAPGEAAPVAIAFDSTADSSALAPSRAASEVGAAGAARALLRGNTDDVAEFLRSRALHEAARVAIELPLRITGVPSGALLQVDRTDVRLLATDGRQLYHAVHPADLAGLEIASSGATSHQTINLPAALYREWAQQSVRLEITYSLALFRVSATYAMAAIAGQLHSAELGRCASKLSLDTTEINFRCRQVGLGPTCYAATLEGPDGQRNPERRDCTPDYRPYVALWAAPLTFFGIDVPVRDHLRLVQFPVPSSQIPESRLLVTTYRVRDHFTRTLIMPALRLAEWRTQER